MKRMLRPSQRRRMNQVGGSPRHATTIGRRRSIASSEAVPDASITTSAALMTARESPSKRVIRGTLRIRHPPELGVERGDSPSARRS